MTMLNDIKKLISFKDLLIIYVWRELCIRYKQSTLGIIWAFLQPLSMMLLFTFIFSFVMPIKIAEYPYPIFFYTALIAWNFFSTSLNAAIPSLSENYNLITKIYFPREILPFSGIILAMIDLIIALLVMLPLLFFYNIKLTWYALWFIPLVLILILFTASVCLIFSALNVYYKDVKLVINFIIQLWFFATPVIYSVDKTPDYIKTFLFLNPMTFIVENLRRCIVENRNVIWWQCVIMALFVLLVTATAYKLFKLTEKKFADVI